MAKRGRKSVWETHIKPRLQEIALWARDGHTDKQIFEALGVGHNSFYLAKKAHPELAEALRVNKQIADLTVENSLYMRALGRETEEVTKEVRTDARGKVTTKHIRTVTKYIPPSDTAIIFWLKNRQPDKWRDKVIQKIEYDDSVNVQIRFVESDKGKRKDGD